VLLDTITHGLVQKYLQYDVTDGYAEIVMDRPDILNAFHDEMIQNSSTH